MWKLDKWNWRELLRHIWGRFWKDRILDQSAKLSFYFLLSLFPLLLLLIALLGRFLESDPVLQEAMHKYLGTTVRDSP